MNDMITVINLIYDLMRFTYLHFGVFSFSLFDMFISLCGISLAGWFFYKLFS